MIGNEMREKKKKENNQKYSFFFFKDIENFLIENDSVSGDPIRAEESDSLVSG